MRNLTPALYLFASVVSYMFLGLSVVAAQPSEPSEDVNKFVHPKNVVLPIIKYDSNSSVRDPFRSGVPNKVAEQEGVPPLERYGLKEYRLTAIVNDLSGNYRGNLVDPTGMGHLVVVGTRVGNSGGQVTSVTRNKLVVTEKRVDANGKEQANAHEFVLGR